MLSFLLGAIVGIIIFFIVVVYSGKEVYKEYRKVDIVSATELSTSCKAFAKWVEKY